ncbi:hypothetical protein [Alteribacillus sp. HJP-4]|uniref:YkvI family membrane protein n=1 Tax=Alteribacillus sp. HJP-4 TaxID=2775394 RepID=UPI0035CD2F7E
MIADGLKWMFLIIGTTIGAGYASGREIWQFFGHESGLAIVLFMIMFIISCYVVMTVSFQHQTKDYSAVLTVLMGPKVSKWYDVIIIFYLFTTTGVMIAGGGAALEMFHIPYSSGILFMFVLLILTAARGIKGLTEINGVLMPILIICLGAVLLWFFNHEDSAVGVSSWNHQSNWTAAFTFTSLNLLPLVAVLSAAGKKIKRRQEIIVASVGSGVVLGGVSLLYNASLVKAAEDILLYEIPLFAIMESFPGYMTMIMTVLLWAAIFTTAASGLFGLVSRLQPMFSAPGWMLAILLLSLMLPVTTFGFASLVGFLYPLYGFLNLYLLIMVLIHPFFISHKK